MSKRYLAQYVAMFGWAYQLKAVTAEFLPVLLGVPPLTGLGT